MTATNDLSPERFYHGTKTDLKPGDLIEPGHRPNFGKPQRKTTWVYLTGILDAAIWGAELARGEGPGRIYIVEPTGPIVDDPDLTDKRFPGNPTKSYCSRGPLRVTGEVTDWQGHSPEALKAMKDAVERVAAAQDALVARIPSEADFDHIHDVSDESAREWASDAQYLWLHAPDAHPGGRRGDLVGPRLPLAFAWRDSHNPIASLGGHEVAAAGD